MASAVFRVVCRVLSADPGENWRRVTSRSSWVTGGSDSIGRMGKGIPLAGTPTDG